MWEMKTRDDGMEVHKFICDYDTCLRRAFAVFDEDTDDYHQVKGWDCFGPADATHVSEVEHYCRRHSKRMA